MTTQNWPDPKRKGYPLFPDRDGKHVLVEKKTGNHIDADWYEADAEYFIPNGSMKTKHAGECYVYSHCESVSLTPAQINEMLAAERERAAKAAQEVSDTYYEQRQEAGSDNERIYADERMCAAQECVEAIRNLGAAS